MECLLHSPHTSSSLTVLSSFTACMNAHTHNIPQAFPQVISWGIHTLSSSPALLIFDDRVTFFWNQGSVLSTHLLQTERSGIWMPMGARFSGPIQIDPKAHPAYCRVFSGSLSCEYSSWGEAVTTQPCKHQGQVWVQLHLYLSYVPAWHITGQPVTISPCCAYSSAKAPLALTVNFNQVTDSVPGIIFSL